MRDHPKHETLAVSFESLREAGVALAAPIISRTVAATLHTLMVLDRVRSRLGPDAEGRVRRAAEVSCLSVEEAAKRLMAGHRLPE